MNRIPAATWAEIRTAYASGIGLREIARNMGIPAGTVLARSKREGWTQQIVAAKLLQRPELARELARPDAIDAITPMQSAVLSTQERKAQLLTKSLRIADKAADRVEHTIDQAGCSQAAVVYGIATEKALLLGGEPTQYVAVTVNPTDIYAELRLIQAEIVASVQSPPPLSLVEAEGVASAPVARD
jgi:uncharacterized protein YjcR